jgi:hypothetical protein
MIRRSKHAHMRLSPGRLGNRRSVKKGGTGQITVLFRDCLVGCGETPLDAPFFMNLLQKLSLMKKTQSINQLVPSAQ